MSQFLTNTLSNSAFWIVNKRITKEVGLVAANLLADLISKRAYFANHNSLASDGSFFNTADNIQEDLCITEHERRQATKALEAKGFISVVKRGMPSKNFYVIHDDLISLVLQTSTTLTSSGHGFEPLVVIGDDANKNKPNKNKLKKEASKKAEERISSESQGVHSHQGTNTEVSSICESKKETISDGQKSVPVSTTLTRSTYEVGSRHADGSLKYPGIDFYKNAANYGI